MGDIDIYELGARFGLYFVPFLFSLCFHEYAHAWMARRKGDSTAQMLGRLTLNPTAHADPIGTYALPLLSIILHTPFFGWAKPVPVNSRNLRKPKEDMFWIAFAGPLSNILLAVIGTVLMVVSIYLVSEQTVKTAIEFLRAFVLINLFLAFFNLIPLHPLDGGKVIARFLPDRLNDKLEENQQTLSIILLVLFVAGGFRFLAAPVYWTYDQLVNLVLMAT